jgi:cytochrome c-type biogenesis protein CcmE
VRLLLEARKVLARIQQRYEEANGQNRQQNEHEQRHLFSHLLYS